MLGFPPLYDAGAEMDGRPVTCEAGLGAAPGSDLACAAKVGGQAIPLVAVPYMDEVGRQLCKDAGVWRRIPDWGKLFQETLLIRKDTSMAETATAYRHIALRNDGVPILAGTTVKVVELVMEQEAWGWSPQEIHLQHPHLSLGQIHSALSYYWDHKEELDRDIARREALVERLEQEAGPSPLKERLSRIKESRARVQ